MGSKQHWLSFYGHKKETFFKIFVFHRRNYVIQVWNVMWASKWRRNCNLFQFWCFNTTAMNCCPSSYHTAPVTLRWWCRLHGSRYCAFPSTSAYLVPACRVNYSDAVRLCINWCSVCIHSFNHLLCYSIRVSVSWIAGWLR